MEEGNDVYKVACYTSKNEQTGNIVEVALWNDELKPECPIVIIATNEFVMTLAVQDLPGLILSLKSIVDEARI